MCELPGRQQRSKNGCLLPGYTQKYSIPSRELMEFKRHVQQALPGPLTQLELYNSPYVSEQESDVTEESSEDEFIFPIISRGIKDSSFLQVLETALDNLKLRFAENLNVYQKRMEVEHDRYIQFIKDRIASQKNNLKQIETCVLVGSKEILLLTDSNKLKIDNEIYLDWKQETSKTKEVNPSSGTVYYPKKVPQK